MVIARGTRWLRAALVAPLLAFALTASSHLALRCTITGVLMPEGCCPEGAGPAVPAASDPQAALRDADCCERVTVAIEKAPATGGQPWRLWPIDISVASRVAVIAPSPTVEQPAGWARAARPPGGSPPLYVATHSFLI